MTKRRARNIEILCRWLLAIVFLSAGLPKLFSLGDFTEIIAAYGLLPDAFVPPVAILLIILEVAAAVGLILNKKFGAHLAFLLLSIFIGVLIYGIVMGLDVDCGCFAFDDPEYRAFSGLKVALFRDVLLMFPLFYIYLQPYLEQRTQRK